VPPSSTPFLEEGVSDVFSYWASWEWWPNLNSAWMMWGRACGRS
jgi:hypothetical protein